jgi:hypothetical protein
LALYGDIKWGRFDLIIFIFEKCGDIFWLKLRGVLVK